MFFFGFGKPTTGRKGKLFAFFMVFVVLFLPLTRGEAALEGNPQNTSGRGELLSQIEQKNKQLEELNKEIEATKKNLQETQQQKKTLQRDLNIVTNTINQLDLSIKSDEVQIQKLELEIESLNYDIKDISAAINDQRQATAKIFVELQRSDYLNGNILSVFLRHRSLTDGFNEVQSLKNLQNQLAINITNLINLHEEYGRKADEAGGKKDDLVFHRRNLEQRKFIAADQKNERQKLLSATKNQEGTYQKQVEELGKLQKQIAGEIETLGAILRTKIDPATLPKPESGVLGMPINTEKNNITQDYGSTSFAQYGYRGKWHNGVDIRASVGTPVLAAEDGIVAASGDQDKYCYKGAYGKFIVINHDNNLTTMYAHLSRVVAGKDTLVKRGDIIGYSGNTGYATGPHLHLTVFAQPTFYMGPSKVCGQMPFGGDLNPVGYL